MPKAWMPEVERIDGGEAHSRPGIGAPRAVWTVTGADPTVWSAREEAERLISARRTVHLVWNPLSGETVQILPATRRGTPSPGSTHHYGQHVDHGDEGRVCLIIAVVAHDSEPFTHGPMHGRSALLAWLDSWGVPRTWPAGTPGTEAAPQQDRERAWARGGHFGHDQVPGSTDPGPGRLDTARLLAGDGREASSRPETTHAVIS
ncbi:hypothetical protein [Nocardiopsis sp. CC223A]|uniref:hypothetical protein n=1 Tax=Nocardiopsis sp. CC223A TaxID=3044051 RepID=UPI00278C1635|nr:hypothetical protein [Nocardiopsis sp. CC223A]